MVVTASSETDLPCQVDSSPLQATTAPTLTGGGVAELCPSQRGLGTLNRAPKNILQAFVPALGRVQPQPS